MELLIPSNIQRLWEAWNFRVCIILSLLLQALLVLASPFRKRTGSKLLLMFVWLAYLLGDWIPAFSIGLISKSQEDACKPKGGEDLTAFWASFLLLHLGGPDTITSFSLEDNEFWLRHLIGLILQVLATAYIFYQSLTDKSKLWIPTTMVFAVGTIKYAERTRALYLASLSQFGCSVLPEPNPGPDYEETIEIYSSMRSVQVPSHVEVMTTPEAGNPMDSISTNEENCLKSFGNSTELDDMQLLEEASRLFEIFKGLIVGLLLSSKDRESSRDFFLTRTATDAFRIIECELNFMYEVLHTKINVVRCQTGYMLRFVSFISILGALMAVSIEKSFLFRNKFDARLTYVLLIGALGLEAISVLMLIFSDRTLLALKSSWRKFIPAILLKRRRWSRSVSQYDMISYCLNDPPNWMYTLVGYVGAGKILEKMIILGFSHSQTVSEDLEVFIFEELRMKSLTANDLRAAMDACSQRGDWALLQTSRAIYFKLKWSIVEYQYAESLLLWHLATELCYLQETEIKPRAEGPEANSRKICKLLSDYMFYLLVMKPVVMTPVLGNWQIVLQDTCAEAKRFFGKRFISNKFQACKQILDVETKFRPVAVKGNKSKSVLFDACRLAQDLLKLEEINKWKLMSRVWVELMSYAAINCRPNVHAQQPSRGGELLTFIWLLMNHLGLGTQFYEQERQAGTKMVPQK
ncbi:hypothetical protein FH972_000328 [Carpinus fangiana]|uniref:DUF4220 domain-containing protein n=1 Tax=Carpinus fangiana TaxID=176857 RepID=A0A5N6Q8K0_9ROSI|nr:hypothetical protein FH972_000328 [Carpinus fangiana]